MYRGIAPFALLAALAAPVAAQAEASPPEPSSATAAREAAKAAVEAEREANAADREATREALAESQTAARQARASEVAANAELERELRAARERLEAAAREVATLSSRLVEDDVLRLRTGGPRRAMLGVQLGDAGPKGGVRVRAVSPGGPAAEAGLKGGDVIVAIDGRKVRGTDEVVERLREIAPGATAKVDVEREGKVRTYAVVTRALDPRVVLMMDPEAFDHALPADMPEPPAAALRLPFPGFGAWSDVEFATLTKDLGRYFGAEKGVLVVRAGGDRALPLRDGDVITAIDGREPQSGAHALRILRSYQPGEKLSLAVLRDRKAMKLDVTVPEGARHGFRWFAPATPATPAAPPATAVPAKPATPAAPAAPTRTAPAPASPRTAGTA